MFNKTALGTKLTAIFLLSLIPVIFLGFYVYQELNSIIAPINTEIPESLKEVTLTSQLDSTAQFIRYYDEVLTQSARNYAFTGNIKWKNNYYETVPKLDEKIKTSLALGDEQDKTMFLNIDNANLALIKLEEQTILLTDEEKKEEAVKVLESNEYWDLKTVYKNGLVKYFEKRGFLYDQALQSSSKKIESTSVRINESFKQYKRLLGFSALALFFFLFLLRFFISLIITRPLSLINNFAKLLSKGNLSSKVEIKSQDELGVLANSLNTMAEELMEAKNSIEKKVKERTGQLERLNESMVGRELKMIELKKEIVELQNKLKEAKK